MAYKLIISNIKDFQKNLFDLRDKHLGLDNYKETDRLIADGYFEEQFLLEKDENELFNGLHTSRIYLRKIDDEEHNNTIHITASKGEYDRFGHMEIYLNLSNILLDSINKDCLSKTKIEVTFELVRKLDREYGFIDCLCKIQKFEINLDYYQFNENLAKYKKIDITNHLLMINAPYEQSRYTNSQVGMICKDFAECLFNLNDERQIYNALYESREFIINMRSSLQQERQDDKDKWKKFAELNPSIYTPYCDSFVEELKKVDIKERRKIAEKYNHLWSTSDSAYIFKSGFPISPSTAEFLAHQYLNLKVLKSKLAESIILDVLITTTMGEKASSLQYHNLISTDALLNVPMGFYKSKVDVSKYANLTTKETILLMLMELFIVFICTCLGGLFDWWLSGLIADNNETARIILFGLFFVATTSYMSYNKSKQISTDSTKEDFYYKLFLNLANLQKLSYSHKSNSFNSLLAQLVIDGVIFPTCLFDIVG